MDNLSPALDEDLLRDLECPVSMEYRVPPIMLCTNGHNICSKCREIVQRCPTCRAQFSEIRNVVLENIIRKQKYHCANRQSGCLDFFSIDHIAQHQAVCEYRKIKCPFQINWNCPWKGFKSDLKEHVKTAHPRSFIEDSTLRSSLFWDRILTVLSCFGELFVHYKRIQDGRLYGAVQLIGTSIEASKYKCEFTLRAANGVERISKTFFVQGYSEDWETIFNSGKCLKLDEDTAKNFVEENKLNLKVTLSTVK
jgi:E3 ubiquitin-protein ligase SIAH1